MNETSDVAPRWQFSIAHLLALTTIAGGVMLLVRLAGWPVCVPVLFFAVKLWSLISLWRTNDRNIQWWTTLGLVPLLLLLALSLMASPLDGGRILFVGWLGSSALLFFASFSALHTENRTLGFFGLLFFLAEMFAALASAMSSLPAD